MPTTPRPQRERINTPENRRLAAEDIERIVTAAQAKEASRRQPEGRR